MIISIRDDSEIPIYLQIRNQIVQGISDGRLAPGEQLPTVRGLAEEIGINSMTVNRAYQLLKQEGFIATERRNGARVREKFSLNKELPPEARDELKQLISEAKIRGISFADFQEICKEMYFEDTAQKKALKGDLAYGSGNAF